MKSILKIILIGCVFILSMTEFSQSNEGEVTLQTYEDYFVKLLGTRDGWPDNMTADEERIMTEHFLYLKDLIAQKKVAVAGPVFGNVFGLLILRVENKEEALEIMSKEPSVVQGVHTYEISPMKLSLMMDNTNSERYVAEPNSKTIYKEIEINASAEAIFNRWTTTDGIKEFFCQNSYIELQPGGAFEIYFSMDEPYGRRGSEDCKILSYIPNRMFSFEWNAPPDFGKLRDKRTQVVIVFEETESGITKVSLTQLGWGNGEEWEKLYAYFDTAWEYVLGKLKESFEN